METEEYKGRQLETGEKEGYRKRQRDKGGDRWILEETGEYRGIQWQIEGRQIVNTEGYRGRQTGNKTSTTVGDRGI